MIVILMISAEFATPDLLKIRYFENKTHVTNYADGITTEVLSYDSNYTAYVVM